MSRIRGSTRRTTGGTLAILIVLVLAVLPAAAPSRAALPPELEGWRDWALRGQEFRRCPFLASATPGVPDAHRCAWPGTLELQVDARGGRFSQRWQLYTEGWVALPGDSEHWPRDVRIDGTPAALVARDGLPQARLAAGSHAIDGSFLWSRRPEQLAIPSRTGIVELIVDGQRIAQPERPNGALWLGRRGRAAQPEQLELQVYRLVEDHVPVRLQTRLQLRVAGEAREELFGPALPEGFVPLGLESELPVRLEPDGRLRVQLRPGSWQILLAARGAEVAATLARPQAQRAPWPHEELWSFAGDDRLRVAAAEGVEGIDPAQAGVPEDWRGYPAFRMGAQDRLRIVQRSRGLENADDDRLSLRRGLWLDFDHGGFTAVDEIRGTLQRGWRLDMSTPYRLESARIGEEPLLVTKSAAPSGRGVELRTPQLDLFSIARTEGTRRALPATGWETRFEKVQGEIHLPPGHRLLAVWGADSAPGSWWARWGLWNLFGVLIVAVFTAWVAGRLPAALALAALLLTYQESPQHIWLWANLIAAMAIALAAPEGRFRRAAAAWRVASFVVLGIALLPLLWGQVRLALYPQLEATGPIAVPVQAGMDEMRRELPAPPAVAAPAIESMQEIVVSKEAGASRPNEALPPIAQRHAPGTLVQTGPGLPDWRFISYSYGWSGPVEPGQRVRFVYIGPFALGLWRITGVVLLAALFLWLARMSFDWRQRLPGGWGAARGAQAAALVLLLAGGMSAAPAEAQSTPDPTILEQLRARLTAPPACVPSCADIAEARITVTKERLEATLQASALAEVALAVPHAGDRWQIDEVSVDGRSSPILGREGDGRLWVPLGAGAHLVRLAGRLAAAESVQLSFPQAPHAVSVEAQGWDVAGVSEGRLVAGSLELTRRRGAGEATGALQTAAEFAPFVRVTRDFALGLDWSIATTVERLAPAHAAFTLEVPLVPGESVLTEGVELRERRALVGLGAGEQRLSWASSLARSESLQLEQAAGTARTEVWRFTVHPQWHLEFEGLPAVLPEDAAAATWVWEFHPRPGERLAVRIARPEPAPGRTLAIDSATQQLTVGKRSTTAHLDLAYRSTQGGRHVILLPGEARVTSVALDGVSVQLRPEKGELPLSLLPGTHAVSIEWTLPRGASLLTRAAAVDLRAPASNLRTAIELPADRWPLAAFGRGVGPAVLYWGELVVFLVTAWLLGRWEFSPLRSHEWLLLGLGLSTLSWRVLAVVALWLFLMRWRERWKGVEPAWRFNTVQVLLALFTVNAVGTLVFSGIRYGLLASPDMGVVGPGSAAGTFAWFVDRTGGPLPQPVVLSLPLWVYRAIMFAWALWIAIALARWLRWAWGAWTANGYWRGGPLVPASKL